MKPTLRLATLSVLLACALTPVGAEEPAPVGETVNIPIQAQPWQARRAELARIVSQIGAGDKQAVQDFDAILTEFEQKPMSRTPMENMEILGLYYLPREGIAKILPLIAANAALGWYDALRFGSESGRSEILHNEGFFKLPMVLAGEEFTAQAVKFFQDNPEQTEQMVLRGLSYADALKDDPRYDHQWPGAYGLERTMCAMGGDCSGVPALPKEHWQEAWEETRARVLRYYRDNSPKAAAPAAAKPSTTKPAAAKTSASKTTTVKGKR